MRELKEFGTVSKEGKLLLPKDRLNQFCSENIGRRIIISFTAVEQGSTESQLGYYWGYIVPTVKQGLHEIGYRFSERSTDIWLRERLSDMITDGEVDEVEKLSKSQMSEYIDVLKEFCSENFGIYIEDAHTL